MEKGNGKMEQMKRAEGRPPKYSTPEELENKVNEYFDTGVRTKEVVIGSVNNKYTLKVKIPTITGLVLYLGFCSRQSFYAYEGKGEFVDTIKRARTRIEREYEEQLQTSAPTGAIFALKNFDWKDTPLIDQSTHQQFIIYRNPKSLADKPTEENVPAANRI